MLQLIITRLDEVDAVQQGSVKRVNGFVCEIVEVVEATEPVTFPSLVTVSTLLTGRFESSILWAVPGRNVPQYK